MGVSKDKIPRGEQRFAAKLTEDNVREMRRLRRDEGLLYREIACRFGVTMSTAKSAVCGHTWRHVGEHPSSPKKPSGRGKKPFVFKRVTPEMLAMGKEILEEAVKGTTIAELQGKYGISDNQLYRYMNTYRAVRDGEMACPQ